MCGLCHQKVSTLEAEKAAAQAAEKAATAQVAGLKHWIGEHTPAGAAMHLSPRSGGGGGGGGGGSGAGARPPQSPSENRYHQGEFDKEA